MRPYKLENFVEIPNGVEVKFENYELIVKGKKGELKRQFFHPKVQISLEDRKVRILTYFPTKREISIMNTWKAHIENMIKGVTEGFVYKLKGVYIHFPFKIKLQGNTFIVENFLGERASRVLEIPDGVKVQVRGEEIIVESHDIELAGNVAGRIEQLTRVTGKDRRKFQDGIYIVQKPYEK